MSALGARQHCGVAALVAVLLIVLGVACSSEEPTGPPPEEVVERLVASVRATRAAGTARLEQSIVMSFTGTPGGDGASGSVKVDAEGLLDLRGRRGRMSVTTAGEGLAGADALAGDMDLIFDGQAMFMRSPFYSQLAPDHEPWLRVTFKELADRGMSQLGQQDPLAFVEALRGVSGDAEEVGREEVRGEPATAYRATVDVERLLSKLPEGSRSSAAASLGQLGIEEMPIEAWLDAEGRLRRLTSDVSLDGEALRGGRMELTLELFEFGVAFDLKRPPPGDVAEFGEVFGESGD